MKWPLPKVKRQKPNREAIQIKTMKDRQVFLSIDHRHQLFAIQTIFRKLNSKSKIFYHLADLSLLLVIRSPKRFDWKPSNQPQRFICIPQSSRKSCASGRETKSLQRQRLAKRIFFLRKNSFGKSLRMKFMQTTWNW